MKIRSQDIRFVFFFFALVVAFFWLVGGRAVAASRPNVVLIQVDDMAKAQLRAQVRERGHWVPAMPNVLSRIGGKGVEMRRYYTSDPICGPSRASLLSGLATHNHGMRINAGEFGYTAWQNGSSFTENLPVWLGRNGYRTAHFGKYINGYGNDPETEVPPGWERWATTVRDGGAGYYGTSFNIDGQMTMPIGSWRHRDRRRCKPAFFTRPRACQYSTDVLTSFALKEVATNARSRRPFYMQLDYNAPHDDGRPPAGPAVPARLKGLAHRVRQNFRLNDQPSASSPFFIRRNAPLTAAMKSEIRTRYGNEVAALRGVDEGVGRVIKSLRRKGLLNNTYVIFTSDNGFFHGEHRINYGKYLPQEPSARQPFLVRGPRIPKGRKSKALGSNLSIASTVLRMSGSPGAVPRDGRSMLRNLRNPKSTSDVPVLLEGFNGRGPDEPEQFLNGGGRLAPNQAVVLNYTGFVAGPWKYVKYAYGDEELYDVSRDHGELRNLVGLPEYSSVAGWARQVESRLADCSGVSCQIDVTPPAKPTG
ncbi:MAG: sulfatase-like hydrolase/transferase [Solirubrobacterales bacterium]|nr:sulfatase-like hydrolase/transferase [Solirubrobacterales bacterium]